MSQIFVNQINFEYELSSSYHDILVNNCNNTPSIGEEILTVSHVYVNNVNLEVPVADLQADIITCTQLATHTIEEVIEGTPVPEPEEEVGHTGAAGRPYLTYLDKTEERVLVEAVSSQALSEEIFVHEIVQTYAYNTSNLDTKIRRPIYKKPRTVEILSFTPKDEKTHTISLEQPKTNSRQRDEEEMLLLGII